MEVKPMTIKSANSAFSHMNLSQLNGETVLVTGATGLIGLAVIKAILVQAPACRILAWVRNPEKARMLFANLPKERIGFVVGDITQPKAIAEPVSYIIHAASQTASKTFVNDPVGTIHTALYGTHNMLELARDKQVKGFVYLSSMEVYGAPDTDEVITETHGTNLDTMTVRSSYPESKRMCEALCTAYHAQFGVPARVIRLTQTFGPGVSYHDGRVFAEFARCAIEGRDIVLHTAGETRRCYLFTEDAAAAILTVLLKGADGEAYNAANPRSYCSIRDMAEMVVRECAGGRIRVRVEPEDEGSHGYAPVLRMNLGVEKLRALGWEPMVDMAEMFKKLCKDMRNGGGQ